MQGHNRFQPYRGRIRTLHLLLGYALLGPAALVWEPSGQIAAAAALAPKADVRIIEAPAGSLVPDVVLDSKGVLHMVYGLEHNAYYIRSIDNGRQFTLPVKVNRTGTVETEMGERGPKLAVGSDGVIHVAWVDDWNPGVKTFVRYARSLDDGATFEGQQTVSTMSGVDGTTLTVDGKGRVWVFWHVLAEPQPQVKSATWLHAAASTNNGASFGVNEPIRPVNVSALACSMCMMRARTDAEGTVYLAFRSAQDSIRDFYVLKRTVGENQFIATRVNEDNWNLDTCPMCGPELSFGPEGEIFCAFMSRHKVYWARSDPGLSRFRLHVATPTHQTEEIYPTAVANRSGQVLFLWQVGPMAVKGTATVKWALYDREGQPSGESGIVGTSFAGTKATVFVGTDDHFYIVTTARREAASP